MSADVDVDRRKNTVDDDGRSWYVANTDREKMIAGPFGSESYARTVRDRMKGRYPGDGLLVVLDVSA